MTQASNPARAASMTYEAGYYPHALQVTPVSHGTRKGIARIMLLMVAMDCSFHRTYPAKAGDRIETPATHFSAGPQYQPKACREVAPDPGVVTAGLDIERTPCAR